MLDEMCSNPVVFVRCRLAVWWSQWTARRDAAVCSLFCAAPNVVVVHPGETATLRVRFGIDIIFIRLIVYVCYFIFFWWRRGTPCFARRRPIVQRSSMCGAMHKSESPSFGFDMVSRCVILLLDWIYIDMCGCDSSFVHRRDWFADVLIIC